MTQKKVFPFLKCYNFSTNSDILNRFVLLYLEINCTYISICKYQWHYIATSKYLTSLKSYNILKMGIPSLGHIVCMIYFPEDKKCIFMSMIIENSWETSYKFNRVQESWEDNNTINITQQEIPSPTTTTQYRYL